VLANLIVAWLHQQVVQDMLVPVSTLSEGMDVMEKHFDVYPVWICPMRLFQEDAGFLHPVGDRTEAHTLISQCTIFETPFDSLLVLRFVTFQFLLLECLCSLVALPVSLVSNRGPYGAIERDLGCTGLVG
jgi:hypothetical protein